MTTAQSIMAAEGTRGIFSNAPVAVNASSSTTQLAGTSYTAAITPTVANTIIVALILSDSRGGILNPVTSLTDNQGLTWYFRGISQIHMVGGGVGWLAAEIWWAAAPVAKTYTLSIGYNSTLNASVAHLFAVSGVVSELAPFDPDVSLPQTGAYSVASTPTTAPTTSSFSTADSNRLLMFAAGVSESTATFGVGAINGVTAGVLQGPTSAAGVVADRMFSETSIQVGPASGASAAFTGATFNWALITDVIVGTSATTGVTTVTTPTASANFVVQPYNTLVVEHWGAGGSGAATGAGNAGGASASSTLGLTAGGGGAGPASGTSVAGTASGGDTNTSGSVGSASGAALTAGFGGAGANGGAQRAGPTAANTGGNAGNAPGGGGSGVTGLSTSAGGGAGGAYCKKTYLAGAPGSPVVGSTIVYSVGTGGAAVTGTTTSGAGANGQTKFTWT